MQVFAVRIAEEIADAARIALFKENPMLSSTRAAKDGRVMELDPTLLVGGLGLIARSLRHHPGGES